MADVHEDLIRDYLAERIERLPDLVTNRAAMEEVLKKAERDFLGIPPGHGGPTAPDLVRRLLAKRNLRGIEHLNELRLVGKNFPLLSTGVGGFQPSADLIAMNDAAHQRDEEPEAAESCPERAGRRAQGPDVGHGRRLGPGGRGPFVIAASRQPGEAFLAEEDREGIDADVVPGVGQFALDVVDRQVPLAHGHDRVADAIACGRRLRPLAGGREEGGTFGGVMAELMTEDAKGAGRVAESACDLVGGPLLDEVRAEGFVLTLERCFRGQEELGERIAR